MSPPEISPGHTNATIETKIAFSPGTYKLTFLLANTPVGSTQINGLTVTIDSSASTSFPAPSATVFTQETAYFFAPTAGSLQFVQTGTPNAQGSVIDDVHLFLIVPEPSAQLLIGSGLLAIGFLLRRRLAQLS
ncbi:MAG: PEP-CTERM sorting domain-containing protein [Acidobacteria bacterium]|nr:PEP-CTERM sorting domain-containing protein [Acidobacteriota bacterium]